MVTAGIRALRQRIEGVRIYARSVSSRLALVAALLLALSACTGDGEPVATSTTGSGEPVEAPRPEVVGAGRIAVLGGDGNVSVIDPDGANRIEVTTDAGQAVYSQPTWSPDGKSLAFARSTTEGFALQIDSLGGAPTLVPMSSRPFYMSWSPGGERIGALHNGSVGLDFEMVDVASASSAVLDRGSPFYFSWSPSGDMVAVHTDSASLKSLTPTGDMADLAQTSNAYLVPHWLQRGIVHVAEGRLVIDDDDRTELVEVSAQAMFVASPDGSHLAMQSVGEGGSLTVALGSADPIPLNRLVVLDLDSGEIEEAGDGVAVGFWWSPDGESLLIFAPSGGSGAVTAQVWSAGSGLTEYAGFFPSVTQLRELFPFFPQYAQSMTFWAPDSSGFTIVGDVDGESGVWVQALGTTAPELVSDGVWASFSS